MADESTTVAQTTATSTTTGADENPDIIKERAKANRAYQELRVYKEKTIPELQAEMETLRAEVRAGRATETVARAAEVKADDPEPDADTDPVRWMKWARLQDRADMQRTLGSVLGRAENDSLATFEATSLAAAKAKYPDYEDGLKWLYEDYKKELMETGELDLTAHDALADPKQRENISNFAIQNGMSEIDAARELVAQGAFNYRRNRILTAAKRNGFNPADKTYDMAKRRGWKGAGLGPKNNSTVDEALKEMERKKNLRAAEQTVGGRDGSAVQDGRVYTRNELEELRRTNRAEYNRAISEIANKANNEGAEAAGLPDILTR